MIPLSSVYCKHWLEKTSIKMSYVYPHYLIKPHIALDIRDSIHYHALKTGKFDRYKILIEETNQKEHSVKIFKNLLQNFSVDNMDKIKVKYCDIIKKFIIVDGLHRISILLYKNVISESIPLSMLQII